MSECARQCTPLAAEPKRCVDWARKGECASNSAYMLQTCAAACELVLALRPPPPPPAYLATEAQCSGWAGGGECDANAEFMLTTCPEACAKWRSGELQLVDRLPTANVTESACLEWARSGGVRTARQAAAAAC